MGQKNSPSKNKKYISHIFLLIALVIGVNIAANYTHLRFDLTADKRFTTTEATKELLTSLKDPIEIQVFLKGEDFPAAFKSLAKSTELTLNNFKKISNHSINYTLIDPIASNSAIMDTIAQYGIHGIPVTINAGKQGMSQKMIFPWALVKNKNTGMAMPVFLPESNSPNLSRTVLNRSEMLLEYNIANAIRRVQYPEKKKIAYLTGNGQPFDYSVIAMYGTIMQFYHLDTVNIHQIQQIPTDFHSIIINKPELPFSEIEKYKIDQYIVQGGNVIWAINSVTGNLDSFFASGSSQFNAMPIDLNIGNMLFQYGVRINHNLIKDASEHLFIPLSPSGNRDDVNMYDWVYFPVLKPGGQHPIVKNMNGILTTFVSSIDTIHNDIDKTILLSSSKYSQTEATPTPILLNIAFEAINPASFQQSYLKAAVLLEGEFESVYQQRLPDTVRIEIAAGRLFEPQKPNKTQASKQIIISDGDIFLNDIGQNGPSDMGVYRFSDYRFDNKTFLLNCLEYVSDEGNLLAARNKNFENRILDPKLVEKETGKWQFINIILPALLIIFIGSVWFFIRKKKYG